MSLLEVKNLKTHFKIRDGVVRAVDGVSFKVEAGESLGIVGESGSGKSVTNLSILGLIPQPPGEIKGGQALFNGKDLLKMSEGELQKIRGNKIGMIFQDPMSSLNPFLTVGRQLSEVLEIHRKMSHKEAYKKSKEMLALVGIPDVERCIHAYPHQYSGGMRQRVMIAMALLCDPSLLIADEPTTALDVTIQAQILDLIRDLQKRLGMGMILITHNLGVVAGVCDRLVVMYVGRIIEEGPTEELFKRPRHPYTRALLESVPRLDTQAGARLYTIKKQPPDLSRLPGGCHFHPRCDLAADRCQNDDPKLELLSPKRFSACWKAGEL
jgi:oligopeptide/dipeptide ABC transporter ATP-binding protein